MAKQPTITTTTTGFASADAINLNFTNIQSQFDNTVSRDASAPNAMAGDLDMNDNDIINVGSMDVASLTVNQLDITDIFATTGLLGDIAALSLVQGDLLYYDGVNIVRLPIGTADQALKVTGGFPTWAVDLDTDTDTVGVTVEEDNVSVQTNVTVVNFLTGLQATAPIVTVDGSNNVTVDLDTFVNG